jgi:hypothetical protein
VRSRKLEIALALALGIVLEAIEILREAAERAGDRDAERLGGCL